MMKKQLFTYGLILLLCQISTIVWAQSSNFTGDGDWTIAANWDNGIPTSSTNVIIQGAGCSVDSTVSCNNFTLKSRSNLTINAGDTLTISGNFNQEDFITINNSGLMIIAGAMQYNGNTRITIGGSVQFIGRLEINNSEEEGEGQGEEELDGGQLREP